jgi:hypothetical protein
LLIQNKRVDGVEHNWDFSPVKEQLQLLPVVFFLTVVFSVWKAVHRDICGEVAREDFSD